MTTTFKMADGDLFFDVNGRLVTVSGFEKVSQDIAEVLLTELDVERDFGSELPTLQSRPAQNFNRSQIAGLIQDSINRLQEKQRKNPNTSADEEISNIESIEVRFNDQTEVSFSVVVRTTNGFIAGSSMVMQQPEPTSLNHLLPPGLSDLEDVKKVRNNG